MITAIMCTRNRAGSILQAVESVLRNEHEDFELLVIDQSDSDETARVLDSLCHTDKRLKFTHTSRVGLSAAYNAGIQAARGELLAFTDDDCVAPANWLRSVEAAFRREPKAYLLYGQVLAPEELIHAEGILPQLKIPSKRCIDRASRFEMFGMGACFAARQELFEIVGRFDEVLGGGGPLRSSQDFDLQYRTYRAGLATLLDPDVQVYHYGIRADVDWWGTMAAYGTGDGGFLMKHVRCGDVLATRLFAGKVVAQASRCVLKPMLGQRHSPRYFRGLLSGAWHSFRFGIDRKRRVYLVGGRGS